MLSDEQQDKLNDMVDVTLDWVFENFPIVVTGCLVAVVLLVIAVTSIL